MATTSLPLNSWTWRSLFRRAPHRNQQALIPAPVVLPATSTPAELLRIAVSQGADLAKVSQLMDLQERWEKSEAKKAYVVAMNGFKANPPEIVKNEIAIFENKNGDIVEWEYSTLDHIHDAILAELSRHGISHRWIVEQPTTETVRVTCILTHKLGHSEQTTLVGPVDHSGSKNAIQAIGSSAKYLERYTLMAATGLADKSPDTDALSGAPASASDQAKDLMRSIQKAPDQDQLRDAFTAAFRSTKDKKIQAMYIAAKDARLKGLRQ
jgi:ERF superfamily protein